MSDDKAKVRFQVGQIEVEFEGSESFMKEDLPGLISSVLKQYETHKNNISEATEEEAQPTVRRNATNGLDHSTNTIANLTSAKSGADLVIAAAACLTLTNGKERMTRADILGEMKSAVSFYKETYNKNLSNYLDGLVKADRLRLISKDTYALSATERQSLEATLAARQ